MGRLYARLHSAGHSIDLAVYKAGYGYLKPIRGHHYEGDCYVEYEGTIEPKHRELAQQNIQDILNDIIEEDRQVYGSHISGSLSKGVVRREIFLGFVCSCGGTHVNSTKELGKVEITYLKEVGAKFRIG